MRAFIAIDFSQELKTEIASIQAGIRMKAHSGRWKHKDNFHLTLKFLDEINNKQAAEIERVMSGICSSQPAFRLSVSNLGSFPGRDCMRVLWLGLGGDTALLGQLYEKTEKELEGIGFAAERRRFSPHITIAQDVTPVQDVEQLQDDIDFTRFPEIIADRLYLFRSEQAGGKRLYTPIREFCFGSRKDVK